MNKVVFVIGVLLMVFFVTFIAPWFIGNIKNGAVKKYMQVSIENGVVDTNIYQKYNHGNRIIEYHTADVPSVRKRISSFELKETFIMSTIARGDTLNHKPNDKYVYVKTTKGEHFTLEFYSE